MDTIRTFTPLEAEYAAIFEIERAVWPDNPTTIAEFKHGDQSRQPDRYFERLVVERGARLVAFASLGQLPAADEPGRYRCNITVHPDFERQGIGTAVYNHLSARLLQLTPSPTTLESGTYAHKSQSIRFLEARGFREVMRWIVSVLDVPNFDLSAYAPLRQQINDAGIIIRPLPELKRMDPHWQDALYELDWALAQDEPRPYRPRKVPFATYLKYQIEAPSMIHNAWYVALDNGRYVGMTQLESIESDSTRYSTGFTGVVRSHRRRGLATALKSYSIEYAQKAGGHIIRTGNEEHNPMYTLNQQMGFTDLTASLGFAKSILPGDTEQTQ